MKTTIYATAALAVAILSACVPVPIILPIPIIAPAEPAANVQRAVLPATPPKDAAFDTLVNAARAQAGLPPITPHAPLDAVATAHAADMVARNYLSHQSPDGFSPDDRIRAANIATCGTSEVVARGYSNASDAFAGWMASPGHRAAILDGSMRSYGLGSSGNVWALDLVRPCPVSGN